MAIQYTQPNPELRAALSAAAFLEKKANPIAPGPGGTEIKSVTGGIMDALHGQAAASGMGAPGMGASGGFGGGAGGGGGEGIQGIIDNLRNAAPTLQQNAKNEQMGQIANMVASKMGGQDQEGIGALQAPIGLAEGGILGYAGGGTPAEPLSIPEGEYDGEGEGAGSYLRRLKEAALERIAKAVGWNPEAVQLPGGESGVERTARLKSEQPPEREYVDRLRVAGAPAPAPAVARAPARAAGAPSVGGGGGGAGGVSGLPDIAKIVAATGAAMGENPDILAAREAERAYAEALRRQKPPGQEELAIRRKAQEDREKLYAQETAEAPMNQLSKLLYGIHMGGLGGGAQAVSQFKDNERRKEAARIAEREYEAAKRQSLIDLQDAFETGNRLKEAESKGRLATLTTHERKLKSDMATHVYTAMTHYAGQQLQAGATLQAARERGLAALMAASIKPPLSPDARLKLDNAVQSKFFTPMAPQDRDFQVYVRRMPGGDKILQDIAAKRIKYDPSNPDKPWGAASPAIMRAADMYRNQFVSSVSKGPQPSEAIPSEDAFKDLGG